MTMTEIEHDTEAQFLVSLMRGSIHRFRDLLDRIFWDRDIAVLVHEPDHYWRLALKDLGWDGYSRIFAANRSLLGNTIGRSDPVIAAWARRKFDSITGGRILVVTRTGSLLLNYSHKLGISLEPGSVDADMAEVVDLVRSVNAPHGGSA